MKLLPLIVDYLVYRQSVCVLQPGELCDAADEEGKWFEARVLALRTVAGATIGYKAPIKTLAARADNEWWARSKCLLGFSRLCCNFNDFVIVLTDLL